MARVLQTKKRLPIKSTYHSKACSSSTCYSLCRCDTQTMEETTQPFLIRIEGEGDIPEWAMLELNGEILQPKDSTGDSSSELVEEGRIELGSIQFRKKKDGKTVGCFVPGNPDSIRKWNQTHSG